MSYRVIRQDDNGFITVMARFAARTEADAMAAAFEARAHKQMYWVEPDAPSEDDSHATRSMVTTTSDGLPPG